MVKLNKMDDVMDFLTQNLHDENNMYVVVNDESYVDLYLLDDDMLQLYLDCGLITNDMYDGVQNYYKK